MNNKIDGFTMFTWFVFGIFLMGIAVGLLSLPLMLLWNWLMPDLFGLPTINLLQAVGLGALSHILFGNTSSIIRQGSTGHKKGSKKSLLNG